MSPTETVPGLAKLKTRQSPDVGKHVTLGRHSAQLVFGRRFLDEEENGGNVAESDAQG